MVLVVKFVMAFGSPESAGIPRLGCVRICMFQYHVYLDSITLSIWTLQLQTNLLWMKCDSSVYSHPINREKYTDTLTHLLRHCNQVTTSVDVKHHGVSLSERGNVTWGVTTVYVHIKLQLKTQTFIRLWVKECHGMFLNK